MGKSQNPLDTHRKAERKKEVIKNKTLRIQSRDAKVIETRNLKSIQTEISSIEQQKVQDNNNTRKLERLRKELKLVQKAEEEKKKNNVGLIVPQRKEESFDYDVRTSYYYDPAYNPYGVAPPGKQILYHMKDGGVTKNRRWGAVLDKYLTEEEKAGDGEKKEVVMEEEEEIVEQPVLPSKKNSNRPPTPPPPPPPPPPLPIHKIDTAPKPPPPSQSVQRLLRKPSNKKSNKLEFDIWASTDEIQINSTFEGITSSKIEDKPDVWYYIDNTPQKSIQGPYAGEMMKSWFLAGFFPPFTPMKRMNEDIFIPINKVSYFQKMLKPTHSKWKQKEVRKEGNEEEDVIQARINALMNANQGLDTDQAMPDDAESDSELPQTDTILPPPPPQTNNPLMTEIPAYPVEEEEEENIPSYPTGPQQQPKLKSYQGDQEVISFVPHNLRHKKIG